MIVDPRTVSALRILRRLVEPLADRRGQRAVQHLSEQLAALEHRNAPLAPMLTPALVTHDDDTEDYEPDNSALQGTDATDQRAADDDVSWGILDELFDRIPARNVAPPATPLPAQQDIVDQAIADARAAGLQLPPFTIRFVEGEGGQASRDGDRYEMVLGVAAWPDALRLTTFHEAQHLADYFADLQLSRVRLERRAIEFAARMVGDA